ncbi:hypothetical protein [Streptomyces colonosanans]|uniref:Uncharacterized protein n=1 Tax=Streptomyces colonosanans TaxID=1428652 RepID=A0A1S2PNX1_9ACTN|nr:hypothetical protein [Streptomyces colonosanans]OIJ95423.1 hypothetical protein BIV24_09075 [Streptomyces colonosanans]
MSKPSIHYMVTMPDGTVPPTSGSTGPYTTVNLTDHVGQVVDHPTPCKNLWFDESEFSYFRTYTRRGVGEVLERSSEWPVQWPVRLFVVEPLGETGNWGGRYYPYWVLAHRLRIVEETDISRAFGPRGEKVLNLIQQQLPELAGQWASEWAADPEGTRARYDAWITNRVGRKHALGWVDVKARSARREAAVRQARELASTTAEKAAAAVIDDQDAVSFIGRRARCLVAAEMFHDLLRRYDFQREVLAILRGSDLDTNAPALARA